MTEVKETPQEVFYGIRISNLSDEILEDVLNLYLETAEIKRPSWARVDKGEILWQLEVAHEAEFRIGSKFSGDSKLCVNKELLSEGMWQKTDGIVSFSFDPNIEYNGSKRLEIEAKQKQFRKAASDYLQKTGFGVILVQ